MIRTGLYSLICLISCVASAHVGAEEFNAPWKDKTRALVIDAYEQNPIDWDKLVLDKRIVGFIGKASDGMPPPYRCKTKNATEKELCRKTFRNYWLKKELYKTRRTIAKALGLKWGAYHLGRRGDPVSQANHFIDFADPAPDEVIVLDVEHSTGEEWITLREAEQFARHLKHRLDRYPLLYTNNHTAKEIAANAADYPILSRLKLWYARYREDIAGVFPMGNWERYVLWQFSSNVNCNLKNCPYRVPGAPHNIDVNVSNLNAGELRAAWPFDGLLPEKPVTEPTMIAKGETVTIPKILIDQQIYGTAALNRRRTDRGPENSLGSSRTNWNVPNNTEKQWLRCREIADSLHRNGSSLNVLCKRSYGLKTLQ